MPSSACSPTGLEMVLLPSKSTARGYDHLTVVRSYLAPVLRSVGITDPEKITGINAGYGTLSACRGMEGGSQ